jgi:hypothetical protein
MTRSKGFKNSNNWFQEHTKCSIKNKKRVWTQLKALFEINNWTTLMLTWLTSLDGSLHTHKYVSKGLVKLAITTSRLH